MLEKRNVHGGYKRNTQNKRLTWICIAHLFIYTVCVQSSLYNEETHACSKRRIHGKTICLLSLKGMTFYWSKLSLLNRTCLIRNRNCLLFTSTWRYPWLSGGVCVAQLFSFLVFFVLNTIPRGRNCWHFTSTWAHSLFFGEVCITHFFLSCVYCFVCLRFVSWVECCSFLICPFLIAP